jgi:hypothetical protein
VNPGAFEPFGAAREHSVRFGSNDSGTPFPGSTFTRCLATATAISISWPPGRSRLTRIGPRYASSSSARAASYPRTFQDSQSSSPATHNHDDCPGGEKISCLLLAITILLSISVRVDRGIDREETAVAIPRRQCFGSQIVIPVATSLRRRLPRRLVNASIV